MEKLLKKFKESLFENTSNIMIEGGERILRNIIEKM